MSNKLTDRETYDPAAVAEYVCDTLCRYRHNIDLTQDELEEICENCNMERLLGITEEIEECKEGEKMGREILFRGKRISDGQWIEGDLSRCVVVGETHIRRIGDNLSTTTHRIDPETVCQYTGLTDKNGRKIFEGDIVKHFNYPGDKERHVISYIKWNRDSCRFMKQNKGEDQDLYGITSQCIYEVIGNIFDNPELLEEHTE